MSRLRLFRLAAMVALGLCLLVPSSSGTASEQPPWQPSIRLVHTGTEFRSPAGFSSGGEYAIAVPAAYADGRLISMIDGSVGPSTLFRAVPTANGAFIFGSPGDQTIERYDVAAEVTHSRVVPFEGFRGTWEIESVTDADSAGRYVLFRGSSDIFARTAVFLFDFERGTLVRSNGDLISGDVRNAVPRSISLDGTEVVYEEIDGSSANIVQWDRSTETRTEFRPPTDVTTDRWDLSPDFEWEVFRSYDPDILPGLDASPRYYRRNRRSGATEVVGVDADDVRRADIYDGGRIVMRVITPTTISSNPSGTAEQLFVFDEGEPARQISVQPDGTPADYGVGLRVAANVDATTIAFTSNDRDLRTGTGEEAWRWYVAELPPSAPRLGSPGVATAVAVRCSRSATC